MRCPICQKDIPPTDGSHTECQDCLRDYDNKEYKIKFPEGLKYGLTCFKDYNDIGELIYRLKKRHLTIKEFHEEMDKLVEKINTAAEAARRPQTEEQKRAIEYAESWYIR